MTNEQLLEGYRLSQEINRLKENIRSIIVKVILNLRKLCKKNYFCRLPRGIQQIPLGETSENFLLAKESMLT
ncbi:hypothetical protein [Zhenhengia yiwuensis]|uniref:Uncharacterized protein n=1 Tax=Zhenhengia yiwuensis TaxID=2763666 RepID=A0A926EP52_9FIRM|nr:hypothetical protein [Zhenhengia yiwuensis]MBC8581642.1 hypothetical protein [Zhenhengia yiwuensis]